MRPRGWHRERQQLETRRLARGAGDLETFGWDRDVECAGVVFGRYETSALRPVDDGRSVFVRRIVRAEYNCTSDSAEVDYGSVISKQSIPTSGGLGGGPGLTGSADYGLILGNAHSHPHSDLAELLQTKTSDPRNGTQTTRPPALQGKPAVVMLAIGREEWREGFPELSWADPIYTWFLIAASGAVIRPRVSLRVASANGLSRKDERASWHTHERRRRLKLAEREEQARQARQAAAKEEPAAATRASASASRLSNIAATWSNSEASG